MRQPGRARVLALITPIPKHCVANIALGSCLIGEAARAVLAVREFDTWWAECGLAIVLSASAVFAFGRPPALAKDLRDLCLWSWLHARSCSQEPICFCRQRRAPNAAGLAIQLLAIVVMFASTLFLGRSFSIVPQYRLLVRNGPYAAVRHPLYASYLAFDATIAWQYFSWLACILWFLEGGALFWRACIEERLLLASDPSYAAYAARVRSRFVPYVL